MVKRDETQVRHGKQKHEHSKKEWEAKIIAHAWKDHAFRKRLLADPKSAIKELHCPLSEKLQIKVIEKLENQWVLILPKEPAGTANLSETELSSFAGASNNTIQGPQAALHLDLANIHSYEGDNNVLQLHVNMFVKNTGRAISRILSAAEARLPQLRASFV